MDWKYKHFHQERVFPAGASDVARAAKQFVEESPGWTTNDAPAGFTAEGSSFGHAARATYRIRSAAEGAKLEIDLLVERAGLTGFMLFDVGGYYSIQIKKWLDGIQWKIHQNVTRAAEQVSPPVVTSNKNVARIFNGCLLVAFIILGLWFFGNFISAIVGLLTGTLYVWGKRGTLVLHGVGARITAAGIITFGLFLAWGVLKSRRRRLTS
jgi:hypothetical protein